MKYSEEDKMLIWLLVPEFPLLNKIYFLVTKEPVNE